MSPFNARFGRRAHIPQQHNLKSQALSVGIFFARPPVLTRVIPIRDWSRNFGQKSRAIRLRGQKQNLQVYA